MKTAFSSWNKRIAPVFDVARQLFVIETEAGRILRETEETLPADELGAKVRLLAGFGVNTLVCGAISRFLHGLVSSYGIAVVPFVAGDLREVIRAWIDDRLNDDFAMPGCCARDCRRSGHVSVLKHEDHFTRRRICEQTGPKANQVRVRNGGGKGIRGMKTDNSCICPQCGYLELNQAGIPCLHMRCPRCGSMMVKDAESGS